MYGNKVMKICKKKSEFAKIKLNICDLKIVIEHGKISGFSK